MKLHNGCEEEEKKEENSFSHKLTERLIKSRKIIISQSVNAKLAERVINNLILLQEEDSDKDITIFINSPGGDLFSGLAIYDMMQFVKPNIKTVVTGLAASMGSVLSLGASDGQRFALPNSKILIHQPLIAGVIQGSAADIEIQAKEMIDTKNRLIEIYVEKTGKSFEEIKKDIERDFWLNAKEALEYGKKGLIDKVINSYSEIE